MPALMLDVVGVYAKTGPEVDEVKAPEVDKFPLDEELVEMLDKARVVVAVEPFAMAAFEVYCIELVKTGAEVLFE